MKDKKSIIEWKDGKKDVKVFLDGKEIENIDSIEISSCYPNPLYHEQYIPTKITTEIRIKTIKMNDDINE